MATPRNTFRVDYGRDVEVAAGKAQRSRAREIIYRPHKAEGRYYLAADAEALLSMEDGRIRPGHPTG